jgi:hypothetical protein
MVPCVRNARIVKGLRPVSATIATALHDLLFDPTLDLLEALDRHFSPDYRQRTDGVWSSRAEFAEHISHLRAITSSGSIHVHEELSSTPLYAERHTVELTKTDGSRVRTEVYVFGEHAPDGRFRRIDETTLLLSGTEEDRELGRAR